MVHISSAGQQKYYFRKNVFGDVTHIFNDAGTLVGKYSYTAFGECTIELDVGGIATLNPFRYRGYYYDEETNLYYLNTRYYDPQVGRFINIDGIEYINPDVINGLNLYAYCNNNPVMSVDPNGNSAIVIGLIIGLIVGAAIGFGAATYVDYKDDGEVFNGSVEWYEYAGATLLGGAIGAAVGAGAGYAVSALPSITSLLGSGLTMGGYATTGAVSVNGEQLLATATILSGLSVVFSSNGRPGNNKKQNEQYREAMRRLGYNKKDWQWRYGHDSIHKDGRNFGFRELLDFLERLLGKK